MGYGLGTPQGPSKAPPSKVIVEDYGHRETELLPMRTRTIVFSGLFLFVSVLCKGSREKLPL